MIELAVEVLKGLVKREKETKSEVMWGIQRCRIGRKLDVAASITRQTNMICKMQNVQVVSGCAKFSLSTRRLLARPNQATGRCVSLTEGGSRPS